MQIKCGTDLVSISRIEKAAVRLGNAFLKRIWTDVELEDCLPGGEWHSGSAASLAVRFAAKEAMAKALGSGIGRYGIRWTDLSVKREPGGEPRPVLSGAASQYYMKICAVDIAVSLSHEQDLAQAFCVILLQTQHTEMND